MNKSFALVLSELHNQFFYFRWETDEITSHQFFSQIFTFNHVSGFIMFFNDTKYTNKNWLLHRFENFGYVLVTLAMKDDEVYAVKTKI